MKKPVLKMVLTE